MGFCNGAAMNYAILDGHAVKPCELMEWAAWLEDKGAMGRIVRKTTILGKRPILVSTVFLGLDHAMGGNRPLWFESMVFHDDTLADSDMERYTTWDEAVKGHARMTAKWKALARARRV